MCVMWLGMGMADRQSGTSFAATPNVKRLFQKHCQPAASQHDINIFMSLSRPVCVACSFVETPTQHADNENTISPHSLPLLRPPFLRLSLLRYNAVLVNVACASIMRSHVHRLLRGPFFVRMRLCGYGALGRMSP